MLAKHKTHDNITKIKAKERVEGYSFSVFILNILSASNKSSGVVTCKNTSAHSYFYTNKNQDDVPFKSSP